VSHRLLVRLSLAAAGLVAVAVVALVALVFATAGPPSLPHPSLPVLPSPVPTTAAAPAADPNAQARAEIASGAVAIATALLYTDTISGSITAGQQITCSPSGRWSVAIDPENVIGHPYPASPSKQDWTQGAQAIVVAQTICPAPVLVSWLAHDPSHPMTNNWTVLLPSGLAVFIDSPTLQKYALRHGRQG